MTSNQDNFRPRTFNEIYKQAAEFDLSKAGISKESLIANHEEALWSFRLAEDLNPGADVIRASQPGEHDLGPTAEHWMNLASQWPPEEDLGGISLNGILIESLQVAIQHDYRNKGSEDDTNYRKSIPQQMITEPVASTFIFCGFEEADEILGLLNEKNFSNDRLIGDYLQSVAGTEYVIESMISMIGHAQSHPNENFLSDGVLSSVLRYFPTENNAQSAGLIMDRVKMGLDEMGYPDLNLKPISMRMLDLSQGSSQDTYRTSGAIQTDEQYTENYNQAFEEKWASVPNYLSEGQSFEDYVQSRNSAIISIVRDDWRSFEHILPRQPNHREIASEATQVDGRTIKFLNIEYMDYEILKQAVNQNGLALHYIPEALRTESLIMDALRQNPKAVNAIEERHLTSEMRECVDSWRPASIPLSECVASMRLSASDSGLDRPIGNQVNAAGEPADLNVPEELKALIDPPKQKHEKSPSISL